MLDPQMVKTVRDQVMDIFSATEDRVSTDDWGSPEFEAYLQKYDTVRDTSEYRTIQKQLRIVRDHNHLECVYLVYFDLETESTIYLVDGTYGEDNSRPGCFDATANTSSVLQKANSRRGASVMSASSFCESDSDISA